MCGRVPKCTASTGASVNETETQSNLIADRVPATLLYRFLFKWVEWTCGITLPYTVRLGRRVRIWHHGGMILHAAAIGDDVHVRQNTTFGVARRDALHQLPVIEDRCDLGCGVVILGPVRVGHDSMIGANAVVVKDVPPFSVAARGPPNSMMKVIASFPFSPEILSPDPPTSGTPAALGVNCMVMM